MGFPNRNNESVIRGRGGDLVSSPISTLELLLLIIIANKVGPDVYCIQYSSQPSLYNSAGRPLCIVSVESLGFYYRWDSPSGE